LRDEYPENGSFAHPQSIAMGCSTFEAASDVSLPPDAPIDSSNSLNTSGCVGSHLTGDQVTDAGPIERKKIADDIYKSYEAEVKQEKGLALYALEHVQANHKGVTLVNTGKGEYRIVWWEGGIEQQVNLVDKNESTE
jgi:hypothetical protein